MAIVKLLRYADLKELGVVNNRVALHRLMKFHNFPPGKLLGANTRVWGEDEVQRWLAARPVERAPDMTPHEEKFATRAAAASQIEKPSAPRKAAAKVAKVETKRSAPKRQRGRRR